MRIQFSHHAKKRMIERGISLEDVRRALEMPDYTVTHTSTKEVSCRIEAKTLKIVYTEEDNYINVITVM